MKLLQNLIFALVASLSILGTTPLVEAAPHHGSVHRIIYIVYWRHCPASQWVQYPVTYSSRAEAYQTSAYLARNYRVQTFIRWVAR